MPIAAQWYEDYRDVLIMRWAGDIAWEEAFRAQDDVNRLLEDDDADFPCALLLDFPENALHVTNALTNGRLMMARRHRRLTKVMLVSAAPVTRALGNTLGRFVGLGGGLFEVVATLDEAEAHLRRAGFLSRTTASMGTGDDEEADGR